MKVHKSIRIEESLIASIEAIAAKELRSFNNQLEYLLLNAVDEAPFPRVPAKQPVTPVNRFVPPTVEEVGSHLKAKGYNIDAEAFVAHYEANGWQRGKNKIKNWKACCTTWAKRQGNGNGQTQGNKSAYQQRVEAGDAKSFNIDTEF